MRLPEQVRLALGPGADRFGGFGRVARGLLFFDEPVGGGEKLQAVRGLEALDQTGDALEALSRLGLGGEHLARLLDGPGEEVDLCGRLGVVAETHDEMAFELLQGLVQIVGIGAVLASYVLEP